MLKYLLLITFLFVGAWAVRHDCPFEDEVDREVYLSCRLFHDVHGENDNGTAGEEEFVAWWNTYCPDTGCDIEDFRDYVDGWPLCSTEVDASFARLAGSDETSDPDLIEEIDVISWYNTVLEFGDPIDQDVFDLWFFAFYDEINDPDYPDC